MRRLEERLRRLERKRGDGSDLSHLTDEQLDARVFDLVQRFIGAGAILPDDWRDQYHDEPVQFLERLGGEVQEEVACVQ
jgi:hypothetical protein